LVYHLLAEVSILPCKLKKKKNDTQNGTDFKGLKPEIILGAMVAHDVYTEHGYVFCITSGLDGKHKRVHFITSGWQLT